MNAAAQQFIERIGIMWENEGLPRIAGRIFGFLFLQAEPCSLDDMAAALGVSKASVSTDARRLEQLGLLERSGRPGDRRDYYQIAPDAAVRTLSMKLRGMERVRKTVATARELPGLPPRVRARFETFDTIHEMMAESITELIERIQRAGLGSATTEAHS
jgi:DNA-binding transcriptional regulator GbsR (MarR family)